MKMLGFSLEEIKELLALRVHSIGTCERVREQTLVKIAHIERKIGALQEMRRALGDIVVEQASPSAQPDARQDSPEPCLSNRAQSAICRGVRRSTFEVGLSTGRSTSRRRTRSDCAGAR
jgi:DNA-binding transcriptional MerR regulator